jgi:hypothetical protein
LYLQQEEPVEMLGGEGEVALKRALNQPRLRRWVGYEFHCSAIDRPYFMRSELGELLQVRLFEKGYLKNVVKML